MKMKMKTIMLMVFLVGIVTLAGCMGPQEEIQDQPQDIEEDYQEQQEIENDIQQQEEVIIEEIEEDDNIQQIEEGQEVQEIQQPSEEVVSKIMELEEVFIRLEESLTQAEQEGMSEEEMQDVEMRISEIQGQIMQADQEYNEGLINDEEFADQIDLVIENAEAFIEDLN